MPQKIIIAMSVGFLSSANAAENYSLKLLEYFPGYYRGSGAKLELPLLVEGEKSKGVLTGSLYAQGLSPGNLSPGDDNFVQSQKGIPVASENHSISVPERSEGILEIAAVVEREKWCDKPPVKGHYVFQGEWNVSLPDFIPPKTNMVWVKAHRSHRNSSAWFPVPCKKQKGASGR